MNLLPIVISLLLLLSALAYSQVSILLQRAGIQREYACFIQTTLRLEQNQMQEKAYDEHHANRGGGNNRGEQAAGRAKINIEFFTKETSGSTLYDADRRVLDRLLHNLYDHRIFFQQALAQRPDTGEQVLQGVLDAIRGKKLNSVSELSTFYLEDPFLNDIWQEMIRKVLVPGASACELHQEKNVEYEPNILDFFEIFGANRSSYRIWLAEQPLLEAIFPDPQVVVEVIKKRKEYYNKLRNQDEEARGAEKIRIQEDLFIEFSKFAYPELIDRLDFTPSLSRPPQRRT